MSRRGTNLTRMLVILLVMLLALLSCSEREEEETSALTSIPSPSAFSTVGNRPQTPIPTPTPLPPSPQPAVMVKVFPTHNEPLTTDWGYRHPSLGHHIMVELVIEDSCLRTLGYEGVNNEPIPSYLLVWPDGFKWWEEEDAIHISDQMGIVVARVGDMVRFSGRLIDSDSDLAREIEDRMSEKCAPPYYLIGDDVSAVGPDEPDIVSVPDSDLYFIRTKTQKLTGGFLDTLEPFSGPFWMTLDGNCLFITDEDHSERYVPLWPAGFYPHIGKDGEIEVRNGGGRTIARFGDRLYMRGSERRYVSECDARMWATRIISNRDLPVAFPQHEEESPGNDRIDGNLQVRNGCMYIGEDILVWPSHLTMSEEDDRVYIRYKSGMEMAREGERAGFKGRRVHRDDNLGRQIRRALPIDCPHGDFWLSD